MRVVISYLLSRRPENRQYVYTAMKRIHVPDWDEQHEVQLTAQGLYKDIGAEKYQSMVDELKSNNSTTVQHREERDMTEEEIYQMVD